MNHIFKITSSLLLIIVLLLPAGLFADFSDIDGHTYESSILELAQNKIIEGYPDGTFRPEQAVSRAEMMKMTYAAVQLNQASDRPEAANNMTTNCFTDVTDEWFAEYVCQAKSTGVVQGYPDGSFKPGQDVVMVEAMKIILEAFAIDLDATATDATATGAWYIKYQNYFDEMNILSKYGYFVDRPASRSEIAYFVDTISKIKTGTLDTSSLEKALYSAGCSNTFSAEAPNTIQVDGQPRNMITYVPSGYSNGKAVSLIVAFHGRTNSNAQVQKYYGLEKATNGEAIIVYPAGISTGSSYTWSAGGDSADNLRDYHFFDQIVQEINSRYCINQEQIYAVGHSLGAWFTNSLACARGDVLRAVGTLGGSRATAQDCTGPVSVMQFHNPNDRLAPFSTGLTALESYLQQNSCTSETVAVSRPSWGNCVEYQGCTDGITQLWCPHTVDYAYYDGTYYPHNWPKETGQEIWNFFKGLDTSR